MTTGADQRAELAAEPRERELGAVHAGNGEGRRRAASRRVRHQSARRGVRGARARRHLLEVRPPLGLGGGGGSLARLGHGLQTRELGVHLGGDAPSPPRRTGTRSENLGQPRVTRGGDPARRGVRAGQRVVVNGVRVVVIWASACF